MPRESEPSDCSAHSYLQAMTWHARAGILGCAARCRRYALRALVLAFFLGMSMLPPAGWPSREIHSALNPLSLCAPPR